VKIVPAGEKTKLFIKKTLNILGLDEYNILDIEDKNGNGLFDITNDFINEDNEKIIELAGMPKGTKFSICIANPPYDNGLHERFLLKFIDIANNIVSIQPSSYILAKKKNKKIINKINNVYTNIETVNGNEVFDAGFGSILSIIHVNNNKKKEIIYNNKKYNDLNDITLYSNDELMVEFKNIIIKEAEKDNLNNHIKLNPKFIYTAQNDPRKEYNADDNWWVLRQATIRGHVTSNGNGKADDYYSIISNNEIFLRDYFYGQYKDMKEFPSEGKKAFNFYYKFNTKQELFNFMNYLKTDFVRGCLYLIKTTTNLMRGELKYIPWFDFLDNHFSKSPREIDDWLFKKYNISDEIRKHIEEILPDYYGIRK
jgi:hypothetical protein